jgi:hypothetical protein
MTGFRGQFLAQALGMIASQVPTPLSKQPISPSPFRQLGRRFGLSRQRNDACLHGVALGLPDAAYDCVLEVG